MPAGRNGVGRCSRRDGTVKSNGGDFLDGTERDHGSILTTVLPSRPVVTVNTVPSISHETPWFTSLFSVSIISVGDFPPGVVYFLSSG